MLVYKPSADHLALGFICQRALLRIDRICVKIPVNKMFSNGVISCHALEDQMIINIQDDILKLHAMGLLGRLLTDKTTKRNIMWATDAYTDLGLRYGRNEEITPELITGLNSGVIKTRARKELEQQSSRTRQRGEVFTPLWVCRKMCDHADEGNKAANWKKYVDARVLEITCGEAPFLVSRYDVETGEAIPVPDRIGLLDRKLRTVNENAQTEEDWLKWAFRTFWATYGCTLFVQCWKDSKSVE